MISSKSGLGGLLVGPFSGSNYTRGNMAAVLGASSLATDPGVALRNAEANKSREIAATAADPKIAHEIAAFRAKVAAAKDPKALLKDPTVLKVLLTANGLGAQAQYPALAQKALLSDTSKKDALANTLPNPLWKSVASTYDFAAKGLSVIQNPKVLDTLANGYAEIAWRASLDAKTPGLSQALTFKAQAATVKSVDQILGDAVLRNVVTTALGIPLQIAFQSIKAQEKAITSRLDISKLQDPKFVSAFTTRYLLAAASAKGGSGGAASLEALSIASKGIVV